MASAAELAQEFSTNFRARSKSPRGFLGIVTADKNNSASIYPPVAFDLAEVCSLHPGHGGGRCRRAIVRHDSCNRDFAISGASVVLLFGAADVS
jgi:hypothetical protein